MAYDPRVFIGRVRWVFAKTMAHYNPREYVLESVEGGAEFDDFVALINQGRVRFSRYAQSRAARPEACATGLSSAVRMAASVPQTIIDFRARVTAV